MDFFATNDEVERIEAALLLTPQDCARQVELAWALRQRDSKRALAMVESLQDASVTQAQRLRMDLIRAEVLWLNGKMQEAQALAHPALDGFSALHDVLGCADGYWLLAWIAYEQGQRAETAHLLSTIASSEADPDRRCIAEAAQARFDAFENVAQARQRWRDHFPPDPNRHIAASCWVEDFYGLLESLEGNNFLAVPYYHRCYAHAIASGQMIRVILTELNLGDNYTDLYKYHTALEWRQRALQTARHCGWTIMIGMALDFCGNSLVRLGKLDAAGEILKEAHLHLESIKQSRRYALVLESIAELQASQLDFVKALDTYQKLESSARALHHPDLISISLCGQARAFSAIGLASAAEQAAMEALTLATSTTTETIPALLALATIHTHHAAQFSAATDQREDSGPAASPCLHYLQRALHLANEVQNYTIPGELYDALAEEYARLGDGMQAYQYTKQAAQSRAKIYSNDADDRAQTLQLAYSREKDALAHENNKRLAAEQAQRGSLLEQTNETLQNLGSIGKQITQHLDAEKVYAVLTNYLAPLLQADVLFIFLLAQHRLVSVYRIAQNQLRPAMKIELSDPDSLVARCMREGNEIILEWDADSQKLQPTPLQGNIPIRCGIFAPLKVANKVLGVMTIQSTYRERYDARAQLIFRTLCAYTAIALSNCQTHTALAQAHLDLDSAHRHLQETQQQLIHQEKMATLGQLIANVAHEINTPITTMKNNSGLITGALREAFDNLPALLASFSEQEHALFVQLFERSIEQMTTLSSREERALTREASAQLQAHGVAHTQQHASLLVQLRAQDQTLEYLTLLQREDSLLILLAAANLSSIYFNASGIETAVANVSKIVFALKSFSRIEQAGEFQHVHLIDGIETVLTLYHNQIKKGTELVRELEIIPSVPCLPDEINQVWTNLIHNALQAMQNRGRLSIRIRQQGAEAVVSIGDTGCGIPLEHHDKIFKPFFTTKPIGEGSGLGLDIVQKIITKHQGRIEFVSELGVGTTFSVYLPLVRTEQEAR